MPTLELPVQGELHRKLQKRLSSRLALAKRKRSAREDIWRKTEELTLAYLPAVEKDNARETEKGQGIPKYTTIQIPYTYGVLMSAHTYLTSVFFARAPVHQFSGRHGEGEQQVQALEALISYQVDVGGFLGPYYIWLYDAAKYGIGILGQYWDKERIEYGQLVEFEGKLYQATQSVVGYEGNKVYNVSPYDFYTDPRVPAHKFQEGEFCIARCRIAWHNIMRRREQGYYNSNIDRLKDHLTDKGATEGSSILERPQFDLQDDTREDSKHPAGGVFWEFYVQVSPSDWGVGSGNYPQLWCFTMTEDEDLIVGATPCGYMHGRFPYDVLESEIEGYGLFSRGMPEIIQPVQETLDWLVNTHFFNVRAAMNNQFIVDPSKLVIRDVQEGGPGFLWRLRPEAYGSDLDKIFKQISVQDVTKGHVNDMPMVQQFGDRALGVNDAMMGIQSQKRTTATETRATTGFGVNRMKTLCEYMSAVGFAPHAQKLVQTSQQYYDATAKLRRVGDLGLEAGSQFLDVSPDMIAGFYNFVPVDGTMPVDRMAQANLWKELLGGLGRMPPQVAMSYDWGRIFAWVAVLAGLKNINQFKIQMQPPEMLAAQAQAGNVIPMPPRGGSPAPQGLVQPGNSASTAAGLNALDGGEGEY